MNETYCSQCGNKIPSDAKFCSECGKRTTVDSNVNPEDVPIDVNEENSHKQIERKLLDDYFEGTAELAQNLFSSDGRDNLALQNEMKLRLDVFRKQIDSFREQYPKDKVSDSYEADYYVFSALFKLGSQGYAQRVAQNANSTGAMLIYGSLAKGRNRDDSLDAIKLLKRALSFEDSPKTRMIKSEVHLSLDDKQAALSEVEYVLSNFGDDQEALISARKLRDEINAKSSKECFIATAVYNSPDAAEVKIFRTFRDEVLLKSLLGRMSVNFYYAFSPPIARMLSNNDFGSNVIRCVILNPLIRLISKHHCITK